MISIENQKFPSALWLDNPKGDFVHSGVVGLGSFDTKKGVDLEIPLGSISLNEDQGILIGSHREYARLYGLAQNYDHITLVDVFGSQGVSYPGFAYENWHAQQAIVSRSCFFEQDPLIEQATVAIDGLFEWCQHNPIQESIRYENNRWHDTEISASSEALEDLPLYANKTADVCLRPVITEGGGELPLRTASLTSDYRLIFRFKGDLPKLSEAIDEQIAPARDLLSLFMGFRAEIRSISLTSPDVKGPIRVYIPFVEASRTSLPKQAIQQMPLHYPNVKDRLQAMAQNWFSLSDDASRAADIMLGVLSNERSIYLDSKFIAAASAFEALSRVGHNLEELPLEKFNERLATVKRDISDSHVRKWACHKLRSANFTPAKTLAHQMLDELEPYSSHIVPDRQRFESDHRNARNAYVHQNNHLANSETLSGKDLYIHTEAVLFLVWGKLLILLGISSQELIDALCSSAFHWNDLYRSQQMYRAKEQEDCLCNTASPDNQPDKSRLPDETAQINGHMKPALTVTQQISHLKSQGVTFKLIDESEAARYLAEANNYLRTRSYRVLFSRQTEGTHIGEYVNLDFADLVALSRIDRQMREVFLLACIDVEHFSKMRVLRLCKERHEDGYAIVSSFAAQLSHNERNHLLGALRARASEGKRHDIYSGDLIAHYLDDMPVWVLLEALEFGPFTNFYLFCADRWNDETMRQEHYVLKSVKALRNACAHDSCIANGLTTAGERTGYAPNLLITNSLNDHGIHNSRSRRTKLRNLRVAQIAALLWSLSAFCTRDSTLERHAMRFARFRESFEANRERFGNNDDANAFVSYFEFIWKLIDTWVPQRV